MSDDRTIITLRPPVWALLLAVLIGGGAYIAGKHIETRDREPVTISVSGEGKTNAVPDVARLSFGIQTERKQTAKEVVAEVSEAMTKALAAVKAAGIQEKDIRSENFSVNPVYDWSERGQIFRGYQAQQSLRVTVRDLDKVSAVLQAATDSGANQAGGVEFTVDDPEAKRSEAREKAIAQARTKAEKMASDLGMRLGKIRGFSEGGGGGYPVPMMARAEMATAGADADMKQVPLPAGEQEIQAYVNITYELK